MEGISLTDVRARINAEIQDALNKAGHALEQAKGWYEVKGATESAELISKCLTTVKTLYDEAVAEKESWH